jgi:hypothetical protein
MPAGTDLFSAYSDPEIIDVNNFDFDKKVSNVDYSPNMSTEPQQQQQQQQQPQEQQMPRQIMQDKSGTYNQSELLQDINESELKNQMQVLKSEIENQKKSKQIEYKDSYEKKSMYDTVFSKQREMIRFFSIALIIVFAISMHQTLSEMLKDYLENTNLSKNKEILLKFMFPVSIFVLAWILKIFVK